MKNYKVVQIVWWDIAESSNKWKTLAKLEKFITNTKANIVSQVGFLFEEDENQVVVISSYFPDDDMYGTCNVIPRGCILEMKELVPKEKEIRLLEQNS